MQSKSRIHRCSVRTIIVSVRHPSFIRKGSHHPAICSQTWLFLFGCYSLLFRRRAAKKSRVSAVDASSFAVFFPAYQRKQRRLLHGVELR